MARKKQETLALFPEVLSVTRKLTDEQFGILIRAAFSYRLYGEIYAGDDIAVDVAFQFISNQIDRYVENCATNARNAAGRNTEASEMQQNPTPIQSISTPIHSISNPGECTADKPPPAHFSPPSVDEVAEYCTQQGYSDISPDRFVSYHQAVNWMRGRTPITNWKATVDMWHRKDNNHGKIESKPVWTTGTVV